MNFDPNIFLKLEWGDQALRYSQRSAMVKEPTGWHWYEGRLDDLPNFTFGFNDFKDANSITTNVYVILKNGYIDGLNELDDALKDRLFSTARATLYFGQAKHSAKVIEYMWKTGPEQFMGAEKHIGPFFSFEGFEGFELDESKIIFKGRVGFPNGVESWKEESIALSLYDDRYVDQKLFAETLYSRALTDTDNPHANDAVSGVDMPDRSVGRTVPIVYGDFQSDGLFTVPCYLLEVDSNFPSRAKISISDPSFLLDGQKALQSFRGIYTTDSGAMASNISQDLDRGHVIIAPTVSRNDYNFLDYSYFACCKGKSRGTEIAAGFGGSADDLLEHPAEIAYDILRTRNGLLESEIDIESFQEVKAETPEYKARRAIFQDDSAAEVLNSLLFEFGFGIFVDQSRVQLTRPSYFPDKFADVDAQDLLERYGVAIDPNRSFYNQKLFEFSRDYEHADMRRIMRFSDHFSRAEYGETIPLSYRFEWAYEAFQIFETFQFYMSFFRDPNKVVSFRLPHPFLGLRPNQRVDLSFHVFDKKPLLVRSISRNFLDVTSDISAWILPDIKLKSFSDDEADPSDYSEAESSDYALFHANQNIVVNHNDHFEVNSEDVYLRPGFVLRPEHLVDLINEALPVGISIEYLIDDRRFRLFSESSFDLDFDSFLGIETLGFTEASYSGESEYVSEALSIWEHEKVSEWA